LQRTHVDDKAILHIAPDHPLESLVDLLHFDYFNVGRDAMLAAEIQ
jgi:hypothetical protein